MPTTHLLLALLVVIIWGINFLFVKLSLEEISPLLLCAIRFILASIPAIFFIKPPAVPFKTVTMYGLTMFAMQFSFLFIGLQIGMTPGLASLLMQSQIFFSLFFAALFIGETPTVWQISGGLISFLGIGLVAVHLDQHITVLSFVCVLTAAASWGMGNLITKKMNHINIIALVAWGSFIACFPVTLLALLFEGTSSIMYTYHHLSWKGFFSVLYIVYISTWVGYGAWNWLLKHHPVGVIAPSTLLVPIIGMLSSVLILGEPLHPWKITAGLLVMSGLCIHLFGMRFYNKKIQPALQEAG